MKIDASTCLFPETSYFIKNLHHETFDGAMNQLAMNAMNKEATVSGGEYAQFLIYNGTSTLTPVDGPDENAEKPASSPLMSLFRFLAEIIKFLTEIFSRGLPFGE